MTPKLAIFCHSLVSDWNHGNAHFLRGIVSELQARQLPVRVFEPADAWSKENLLRDHGVEALESFRRSFPHLTSTTYRIGNLDLEEKLEGVDLVLVHEWNDPLVISAIGRYRRENPHIRVLFHDTHHRALTASEELARFDLSEYDGVLAYGQSLKEIYARGGWGSQVYVWHEAADIRTFYPREAEKIGDLIWVGNWGDEERTEELREFFIDNVRQSGWKTSVYGVRYPEYALRELESASICFGGWLPNYRAPEVFAQFKATIHVPRRPYTAQLIGIPTIRPFEALACGIPLVSSPWQDTENLFRVGTDFLMARNGREMQSMISDVLHDESAQSSLIRNGLETIRRRHTCGHRVDQLLSIYDSIKPASADSRANGSSLVSSEASL